MEPDVRQAIQQIARSLAEMNRRLTRLETLETPQYTTGTFTTTFANAGGGTPGVYTYGNQQGFYIRVGGVVFIWGRCEITAIGTLPVGGTMSIAGLPFTAAATYVGAVMFGSISNFNYTAAALSLNGQILPATTSIDLRESFDNIGTVQVPAANFTNVNCALRFAGMYLV